MIISSLNTTIGETPHFASFHLDRTHIFTGDNFMTDDVFYSYDDHHKTIKYKGYLIRQYIKSHLDIQNDSFIENTNKARKYLQLNVNDT